MATTLDSPIGLRERGRELIVRQLVRLLERADEIDVLLEDCLAEAEDRFVEMIEARNPHESRREFAGEGPPGDGAQE